MTDYSKIMDADSAAALVSDGATVGLVGGGGGLLEADTVMGAIEARFLGGDGPRDHPGKRRDAVNGFMEPSDFVHRKGYKDERQAIPIPCPAITFRPFASCDEIE